MQLPLSLDVQLIAGAQFTADLVEAAIEAASLMVDSECFAAYEGPKQAAILKFLAAHVLGLTTGGEAVASKSIDGVSYSFRSPVLGEGLKGTVHGQTALMLDSRGCLRRSLGRPVKVTLL